MVWIFALGVLVLLVVSTGFRKTVVVGVGLVVGVVGLVVAYGYYQGRVAEREREAKTRITQQEISLRELTVQRSTDGAYRFAGHLTNLSPRFALAQVKVK